MHKHKLVCRFASLLEVLGKKNAKHLFIISIQMVEGMANDQEGQQK